MIGDHLNRNKQTQPSRKMTLGEILNHAQALREDRQYAAAESIYAGILKQIPEEPNTLRLLGTLRFQQGWPDEAIACLRRSAQLLPDDADSWLDLANVFIETGELDQALESLRRSLAIDPKSAIAYNSLGVACLRSSRLEECELALLQGLELEPQRDDLLYNLGLLRELQGRTEEAIKLLQQSANLAPQLPERWLSLGKALIDIERHGEAVDALSKVLSIGAGSPKVFNFLGIAMMRCGQSENSESVFLEGLKLAPESIDLHWNYSRLLYLVGRMAESIDHCQWVLKVEPTAAPLRIMLSQALLSLGKTDDAVANLREWKSLDPQRPEPDHMLAAITGETIPKRASDQYVQHLFDDFASSFERNLQSLNYRVPQLIAKALSNFADRLPEAPCILDAGCGTGLCGPLLKEFGGRLVGVDLSPAMLEQAKSKAVYESLEHAELTAYLERSPQAFDVVVSADTLCYFGELADFFAAAHSALRKSGVAIFSVEALPDDTVDYQLHVHGRYSHSMGYIRQVLTDSCFDIFDIESVVLRREMHDEVRGWVFTAVRIAHVQV